MVSERFDAITKSLATRTGRRVLAAAAIGGVLALCGAPRVDAGRTCVVGTDCPQRQICEGTNCHRCGRTQVCCQGGSSRVCCGTDKPVCCNCPLGAGATCEPGACPLDCSPGATCS